MQNYTRWTEDELASEIARLGELIDEASKSADERSRCAVSYLQQVLKDRRDMMVILRQRDRHMH